MSVIQLRKEEIDRFTDVVIGFFGDELPLKTDVFFRVQDETGFLVVKHKSGFHIQYQLDEYERTGDRVCDVLSWDALYENVRQLRCFATTRFKKTSPLISVETPVCDVDDSFFDDLSKASGFTTKLGSASSYDCVFLSSYGSKLVVSATKGCQLFSAYRASEWLPANPVLIPFTGGFSKMTGFAQFFVGENLFAVRRGSFLTAWNPVLTYRGKKLSRPDMERLTAYGIEQGDVTWFFDEDDAAFLLDHWEEIPCRKDDEHKILWLLADDDGIQVYGKDYGAAVQPDSYSTTIQLSHSCVKDFEHQCVPYSLEVNRDYLKIFFEMGIFVIHVRRNNGNALVGRNPLGQAYAMMPLSGCERLNKTDFAHPSLFLKTEKKI